VAVAVLMFHLQSLLMVELAVAVLAKQMDRELAVLEV
jgi:hypothetical protein